jgi:hypothetical protein
MLMLSENWVTAILILGVLEETVELKQRTTQHHIPEDDTLHNHHCENLKSYNIVTQHKEADSEVYEYTALCCDDLSSIINIKGPVMLRDDIIHQNVTFWEAESINETDEGHDASSNSSSVY